MQGMYSMRSPAVKRLMKEAQELREPTEQYACHPLEDNLFEWHFTIRGPADSDFDGGLYHGRIILPPEYPMKPPSIIILTPNGRFEVNKKICLSISGHHPESWQPSWSLRTALLAIIGFMPTHGAGALGSLDYTPEERKILAKRSQDFKCPSCGYINNILKPVTEESKKTTEEARELAAQIDFKDEKEKNAALKTANQSAERNGNTPTASEGTGDSTSPQSVPGETPTYPLQQFGQCPLRMPFFPPFPQMNPQNANTGSTSASQVPRFPLPFVSPFYPPVMQSGNFPMLPMMPGMQVPPWQQKSSTTPVSPQSQPAGSASTAPIQSQATGSPSASSGEATQSSSRTPATNDRANEQSDNSSETQTETMTSSTVATANTSSNDTAPSSPDGLRQRNVTAARQSGSHERAQQSAEFEQRDSQRTDRFLLLFAVFVIIVIALLLIRRLHMMKLISLPL